jgi:hypothetical protein
MNLKLKATLLWLLAIVVSITATVVVFLIVTLILQHTEMVLMTCIIVFMIYVLISVWVSIYHYLKSKEKDK